MSLKDLVKVADYYDIKYDLKSLASSTDEEIKNELYSYLNKMIDPAELEKIVEEFKSITQHDEPDINTILTNIIAGAYEEYKESHPEMSNLKSGFKKIFDEALDRLKNNLKEHVDSDVLDNMHKVDVIGIINSVDSGEGAIPDNFEESESGSNLQGVGNLNAPVEIDLDDEEDGNPKTAFIGNNFFLKEAAGKYDHIDFKPPASAAKAAARGLELRKKNKGRGGLSTQQAHKQGIGSGVARAVSLKNRKTLSPATVRRMKAFFDRHAKNKSASGGKPLAKDKGYISHLLWGGDPGRSWANKVVNQMNAADKKSSRAAQENALKKRSNYIHDFSPYKRDLIVNDLAREIKSIVNNFLDKKKANDEFNNPYLGIFIYNDFNDDMKRELLEEVEMLEGTSKAYDLLIKRIKNDLPELPFQY